MFAYSGPRIDSFRTMYQNADGTPTLVAVDSLSNDITGTAEHVRGSIVCWPNPTVTGEVEVTGDRILEVKVFDAGGRRVEVTMRRTQSGWRITLPRTPGAYQLLIRDQKMEWLERVIRE
jgi:hypothetical protein